MKNKVKTLGYFKKRLKDNGFIVLDLFRNYNENDKRKWSILINPGQESVICTCYENYDRDIDTAFVFDDGGRKIPKNFIITSPSMESIIEQMLLKWKINTDNKNSPYFRGIYKHKVKN